MNESITILRHKSKVNTLCCIAKLMLYYNKLKQHDSFSRAQISILWLLLLIYCSAMPSKQYMHYRESLFRQKIITYRGGKFWNSRYCKTVNKYTVCDIWKQILPLLTNMNMAAWHCMFYRPDELVITYPTVSVQYKIPKLWKNAENPKQPQLSIQD